MIDVDLRERLRELRADRAAIDACIAVLEARLDGEAQTQESLPLNKFTRGVLAALRAGGAVRVVTLSDELKAPNKRVHNSLRTLERRGDVERIGRGVWRARGVGRTA